MVRLPDGHLVRFPYEAVKRRRSGLRTLLYFGVFNYHGNCDLISNPLHLRRWGYNETIIKINPDCQYLLPSHKSWHIYQNNFGLPDFRPDKSYVFRFILVSSIRSPGCTHFLSSAFESFDFVLAKRCSKCRYIVCISYAFYIYFIQFR